MSGDLMAKPFTYVTKTEKSLNPFRKKSGLMNVLARTSTKNRICTKKGILNIFSETDGKEAQKFLGDIFVSIIELNWGWINFIFVIWVVQIFLVLNCSFVDCMSYYSLFQSVIFLKRCSLL